MIKNVVELCSLVHDFSLNSREDSKAAQSLLYRELNKLNFKTKGMTLKFSNYATNSPDLKGLRPIIFKFETDEPVHWQQSGELLDILEGHFGEPDKRSEFDFEDDGLHIKSRARLIYNCNPLYDLDRSQLVILEISLLSLSTQYTAPIR